MNLILFVISSIFLACYLGKRMRVASAAHMILFIFVTFVFLFNSGFAFIDRFMIRLIGEFNFNLLSDAITANEGTLTITISALLVIEIITMLSVSIVAIILLIRGFKKFLKKVRVSFSYRFSRVNTLTNVPNKDVLHNYQTTYLILKHLRN